MSFTETKSLRRPTNRRILKLLGRAMAARLRPTRRGGSHIALRLRFYFIHHAIHFKTIGKLRSFYVQDVTILSKEAAYWSMNMNLNKFGHCGLESTSYYGPYEVNTHFPRMDMSRRSWEYTLKTNSMELPTNDLQPEEAVVAEPEDLPEES